MNPTRSLRPLAALPLLFVFTIAAYALLVGCGQKSDSGASSSTGSSATPAPEASTPAATPPAPDTSVAAAGAGDIDGAKIFATRCALCHGPSGHGDGVGAKGLNPQPRNFHDTAYMKTRTDAQLSEIIHKGKGVMPAWGKVLTDQQIAAVLAHVRTFAGTP